MKTKTNISTSSFATTPKKTESGNNQKTNTKLDLSKFVNESKRDLHERYKEQVNIGKGANGKVKLVYDTVTNEMRAMKIIKKSDYNQSKKKIENEIEVLKKLDHVNIIRLLEFYQDEENYFLITEYCSGKELFERIVKMNHFSENDASIIMTQILSAVMYCHKNKIVHRY